MQGERVKNKSVLGLRLSYLSRIPVVRSTIQREMQRGRDLLDIMRPLTIEHHPEDVVIDFVSDDKEEFVAELNTLMPDLGTAYSGEPEVQWDKARKRNHDWSWWEDRLPSNSPLSVRLHEAVETVLRYKTEVDAFGRYESPEPAVYDYDSGRPQLDFQTTERYVRDPMTDK